MGTLPSAARIWRLSPSLLSFSSSIESTQVGAFRPDSRRLSVGDVALDGHTDSKQYPPGALYTNWELSADRANAARRLIQAHGIRGDQVTQVRGFAVQSLRKPDAPQDPSNRRISLIVEYEKKPAEFAPVNTPPTSAANSSDPHK